ncbi:MAG: hypothetical protein J6A21_03945, partial [Lentisphaeria bacterium]|nr:hypothetical protein [Lentisphaeria bacterium]
YMETLPFSTLSAAFCPLFFPRSPSTRFFREKNILPLEMGPFFRYIYLRKTMENAEKKRSAATSWKT